MRYTVRLLLLLALCGLACPRATCAEQISKESMVSQGVKRSYYLFVPETIKGPAPLLITLHGSGGNGRAMVEQWTSLAKEHGLIVAGPDSRDSAQWKIPEDGPDFLYELVELLKVKYPVDARRIYLFGHSAGAGQALYLALLESEYFAAVAAHAGPLDQAGYPLIELARRKTPIILFVGTQDERLPLTVMRATREVLNTHGFGVQLIEIPRHTHRYADRAPEINLRAWEFFKEHELAAEPRYQQYRYGR